MSERAGTVVGIEGRRRGVPVGRPGYITVNPGGRIGVGMRMGMRTARAESGREKLAMQAIWDRPRGVSVARRLVNVISAVIPRVQAGGDKEPTQEYRQCRHHDAPTPTERKHTSAPAMSPDTCT